MEKLALDGGTPVRTGQIARWPVYGELEKSMLLETLESGKWGGAPSAVRAGYQQKISQFEQQFAKLHQAQYGVSTVNGTIAITVALQAAGIETGDEVIMPPYTFIATATAALAYGVIPRFVDIEEDTFLLDPDKVEKAITPRTKAIIVVHIAGAPANMTRFREIANKHQLVLIEDAAQAVGASWEHRGVGSIGDLGTFSFQSSKNLTAGEGGMITTNREELYQQVWSLCNVGRVQGGQWYQHDIIGQNYRITEWQAAVLLAQMTRLEEQMRTRERNAHKLDQFLAEIDGIQLLRKDPRITRHAYHLYMFKLAPDLANKIDKNDLIKKVQAEGIPLAYGYVPLNRNQAIIKSVEQWSGETRVDECPVCERICENEALWLGQNILLSEAQLIEDVATALQKVIRSY